EIKGFRGFKKFRLNDLGRINLLVGSNNGGKTSVLEAIQILTSQGDIDPFYTTAMHRGEYIWQAYREKGAKPEIDICRFFYNYKMELKSCFSIQGKYKNFTNELQASIIKEELDPFSNKMVLFDEKQENISIYALKLSWIDGMMQPELPGMPMKPSKTLTSRLSHQGGIPYGIPPRYTRSLAKQTDKVFFISTASLSSDEIIDLLDDIILTPEEQLVIDAIKIIEPTIERIASIGSERKRAYTKSSAAKGGVVVKCKGIEQRIPIGSMGDGIWRMLGITLALVKAEGGILLIDEIDTGLHFTVMENMWKLIAKTAERLDVQVFATTHSSDCWTSLATILYDEKTIDGNVSIQRIEKDTKEAVAFTEDEIIIAAEREIEVR
ncbi:AAA family ATPase, partial [Desulfobacterales bacterium HSG16]|nr:AAA family ATPase [Desulfobacterales bacterium HSG16]